jgi:hypothetical protein
MRTYTRVLAAAALVAALTLALPARAEAASPGASEGLWSWLTGLLESRLHLLLGGHAPVSDNASPGMKEGSGIKPHSGTIPPATGDAACPEGSSCGDAGPGLDPNG